MAGDPHRHTKSESLKRLLRRRGRRTKTGANSGRIIQMNVWHGKAQFKPSGAGTMRWVGIFISGMLGILIAVYAGLLLWLIAWVIFSDQQSLFIKFVALPLIIITLLAPFWGTALIGWIYVRLDGNGEKNRERLIAAADKLRAKKADAQDAGANRAR
ncbi:hypothetical protein HJA_11010 [Hyphomonas jannaschiana VP2]|uniref:Uncharacterized protein n=2 Tax=Hyphomonas jannaschiana TaxID=86 RepID=A0A059FBY0_9PROT|nr:hypothetical protein HJA_11010 [Hyphomonas jannaschiana VP2]